MDLSNDIGRRDYYFLSFSAVLYDGYPHIYFCKRMMSRANARFDNYLRNFESKFVYNLIIRLGKSRVILHAC